MNEDDDRRLHEIWCRAIEAAERLTRGGLVSVTIKVDRAGHIDRRNSTVNVKTFPLDERGESRRS